MSGTDRLKNWLKQKKASASPVLMRLDRFVDENLSWIIVAKLHSHIVCFNEIMFRLKL